MDRLTRSQFGELARVYQPHCVTLLLPTHRSGRDNEQDPIRLKNLLTRAEDELAGHVRRPVARRQLKPVQQMLDDSNFWLYQGEGLAIFLTPERMQYFRLPITLPELTWIGSRFHITPLIPAVAGDGRFYVLALSPGRVRFFSCTREHATEIEVADLPKNYEDLGRFIEEQPQLQFRTGTPAQAPGEGRRGAMFFGHGEGTDKAQWRQRLGEFSTLVDRALQNVLHDEEAPLVLACDVSLVGIYRQTNSYAHLVEQAVIGNPDIKTPDQLAAQGWQLVKPLVNQAKQHDLARLQHALGTGQGTDEIERLVPAAYDGRVDLLVVEKNQHIWGCFDSDARTVTLADQQHGVDDLLNLAAAQTYLNGGVVYLLPAAEIADFRPAAASFRY